MTPDAPLTRDEALHELQSLVKRCKNYLQWQQEQGWDGVPADPSISWGSSLKDEVSSLLLQAPGVGDLPRSNPQTQPTQQRQPERSRQPEPEREPDQEGAGALELMRHAMDALLPDSGPKAPRRKKEQPTPPAPTPPPEAQQVRQERQPVGQPDSWWQETQQVVEVPKTSWDSEAPLRLSVLRDVREEELIQKQEHLQAVHEHWSQCDRCGRSQTRQKIVPGKGPAHSRLMLIGEGPSQFQDEEGKLWVGKRGPLLQAMLRAIGVKSEEVYYTTVVRCFRARPRVPNAEEIQACFPLLQEELNVIRPEFVVTLGAVATQSLLRVTQRLANLRGKWHQHHGVWVFPTYSPAYLLNRPQFKKSAWADWQVIRQQLVEAGCVVS